MNHPFTRWWTGWDVLSKISTISTICLSFFTFNQSTVLACALQFTVHSGSSKAQNVTLVTCILELNNNIVFHFFMIRTICWDLEILLIFHYISTRVVMLASPHHAGANAVPVPGHPDAVPAQINFFSEIFILCKVIRWAGLDPLAGRFLPAGRKFDTPDLNCDKSLSLHIMVTTKSSANKSLSVFLNSEIPILGLASKI